MAISIPSIDKITQWIIGGLFGGYTAANILKWYWWRLNGNGYFWRHAGWHFYSRAGAGAEEAPGAQHERHLCLSVHLALSVTASIVGEFAERPGR